VGIRSALIVLLIATVAVLAALPLSVHSVPGVLVNLLVWGFFGFSIPPVVSSAVVAIAEHDAPSSVGTASSTTIAALNLGVASGSFVGDRLLGGPGLLATPLAGVVFVAVAVVLTVLGVRRRPPVRLPHEQVVSQLSRRSSRFRTLKGRGHDTHGSAGTRRLRRWILLEQGHRAPRGGRPCGPHRRQSAAGTHL
jgi:MFS family permease